jgi:hypothetical protein
MSAQLAKEPDKGGSMRKALIAAIGTASAATMITGASLAAASASAAGARTEHFQIMTTSATSSKSSIIATGAFTAGGVNVGGNGNNGTSTAVFPGGTFKITHRTVHAKPTFNSRTCLFTLQARGTYKLAGGTGKYAEISGHGTFVVRILAVFARNSKGQCTQAKVPAAFQQVINAHGRVNL